MDEDSSVNEAQLLQYFRNYVIANGTDDLKETLQSSVEFRRRILRDPPDPIYVMFGFYFCDPNLVILFN